MFFHNTNWVSFCPNDNPKANPFTSDTSFTIIRHRAFYRHCFPVSLFLSISISSFLLLFSFLLLSSTLRSIPTVLINKSYSGFLLFLPKATRELFNCRKLDHARTLAVFHLLLLTHEINFVHFPFPVAIRRRAAEERGIATKPRESLRHAY